MKRAFDFGPALAAVLSLLVGVGVACERSDQLLSAVDADRSGWAQRTSALKTRTENLDQRLHMLPAEAPGTKMATVARRRSVSALVAGSRESLFDLDRTIEDDVREVKTAIGRGDPEGEQKLNTVAAAIDGYVQQQEQSLTAAEAAMVQIEEAR